MDGLDKYKTEEPKSITEDIMKNKSKSNSAEYFSSHYDLTTIKPVVRA
jgi:hypothetical protein